jgi:hypothetical protein
MAFKTAEVPRIGAKLLPGKECGIVTDMTGHQTDLIEIGNILRQYGNTDFDLNPTSILHVRKVKNSTRACTLLNFLMRFLDAEQMGGKRWFFRPVMAYSLGYRATSRRKIK